MKDKCFLVCISIMKAVILAAGKGTRMLPLTRYIPKPMIRIHGIPILEHILNSLPDEISEVILVVGHLHQKINKYFEKSFKKNNGNQIKVKYVLQKKMKGTWKALKLTKNLFNKKRKKELESFLLLNADDLQDKKSLKILIQHKNALLAFKHKEPEKFGVITMDKNNFLVNIIEKPTNSTSNIVFTGVYVLESHIFKCSDPQVVNEYLKDRMVKVVEAANWVPIGSPEDFVAAHRSDII